MQWCQRLDADYGVDPLDMAVSTWSILSPQLQTLSLYSLKEGQGLALWDHKT